MNRMEYVQFYAEQLQKDNALFKQHKTFINAQLRASKSFFTNYCGEDFEVAARKYLKGIKKV